MRSAVTRLGLSDARMQDWTATSMNYYDRNMNGNVRWYDWIAVFWLTIVAWIFGQLAFTSPFLDMLRDLNPEAADQLNELMNAGMTTDVIAQIGFASLLFIIGGLMAAIGFGVHYLGTKGRGSLVTGLIGAFMTFAGGGIFLLANGEMGEANGLILSVVGLSPVAYMLMLLTFPAALGGLYLGWKLVHKLPLKDLHTAWVSFRWRRVFESFLIMWVVLAAYGLFTSQFSEKSPEFVFDAARFLPYAILSLLLLPIQSATEEIVVRGYMNKGLTHILRSKWVAFILTSGLFMALHLANPEAQAGAEAGNLPIVMSGYFFFGFACCLMVLIDDGLESAIGVHAGNNTFAAIFVNYENSALPTPSIWQVKSEPTSDAVSVIVILMIVLVILYATRRPKREKSII